MSARERKVLTGRSNQFGEGVHTWTTYTKKEYLNDPLSFSRPFTPENKPHPIPKRTKYLPTPRHRTLPPVSPERKPPPRRSICPAGFVEKQMEPDWFHKIDSKAMVDERFKTEMAREFVERNRDRMWMYDISHHKKTPRTSCNMLLSEMNFIKLMKIYHRMESALDRGTSSHKINTCFDESKLIPPASKTVSYDTFGSSLNTSRDNKEARIRNLLRPAMNNTIDINRRGALHDRDFGNFSRYSAHLAKNNV